MYFTYNLNYYFIPNNIIIQSKQYIYIIYYEIQIY